MAGLQKRKREGVSESGVIYSGKLLTGKKKLKSGESMVGCFDIDTGELKSGRLSTAEYVCEGEYDKYYGLLQDGSVLYRDGNVRRGKYARGNIVTGVVCEKNFVQVGQHCDGHLIEGLTVRAVDDWKPDSITVGKYYNDRYSETRHLSQGTYIDTENNILLDGHWDKSNVFTSGMEANDDVVFIGKFSGGLYDTGTLIFRDENQIQTGTFTDGDLTSGTVVNSDGMYTGEYSGVKLVSGIKVEGRTVSFRKPLESLDSTDKKKDNDENSEDDETDEDETGYEDIQLALSTDHKSLLVTRKNGEKSMTVKYNFVGDTAELQKDDKYAEDKNTQLNANTSDDGLDEETKSNDKGKEKVPLTPIDCDNSEEIVID